MNDKTLDDLQRLEARIRHRYSDGLTPEVEYRKDLAAVRKAIERKEKELGRK